MQLQPLCQLPTALARLLMLHLLLQDQPLPNQQSLCVYELRLPEVLPDLSMQPQRIPSLAIQRWSQMRRDLFDTLSDTHLMLRPS